MTLVITGCTNRKRRFVQPGLHMGSFGAEPLVDLATRWCERLNSEMLRHPAYEIYGGRGFQEARSAAALLDADLLVVSAGLGLIDAAAHVPPYSCTVLDGAADAVKSRVSDEFTIEAWWRALSGASTFSVSLKDLARTQPGPLLISLSETYLEMLAPDLATLPGPARGRIRIFTGAPLDRVPPSLREFRMPYDARLDGPDSNLPGTRSDFASRALAHFVGMGRGFMPQAPVADDAEAVRTALATWRAPGKFDRKRYDDDAMTVLIARHWDDAGGSSSRLLRYFRDELHIACEQSRFAMLVRQVRENRI